MECRGDVVGVFDAEDEVHPRLLRQVAGAFDRSGAHVVQGGVQLVNFQSSWYALRNCLEYFFWFRSRLHLHAERRFIPLGGNTVFVRTDLLVAVGGWDEGCLAEDCDLGVRLSSVGARVDVAYDPLLVTREETPGTLRGLLKQRTRWNQGFLQVLRKGEWRRLPTRSQRALARYTLAMPFLQAFTGLVIPLSIYSMLALKIPVALALLSFLPVIPTLAALSFELVGLREFGRVFYAQPRPYDYVRLVLGLFPYQLLLAAAAVRAVVREALGMRGWEKTAHTGAHRGHVALPLPPDEPELEPVLVAVAPADAMTTAPAITTLDRPVGVPAPAGAPSAPSASDLVDGAARWPERPPATRRALCHGRAWVRRHRVSLLLLTGLLSVVGIVHGVNLTRMPLPVDDEGTYMAQAWSVQVHHALTPYTYWYDHPPLGWIQLAGWTWVTHGFAGSTLAIDAGRRIMLVYALVDAALLYLIARRLRLSRLWSSIAVLAFALSPVAVEYQRMVYLDNLALPWLLGAFALALTPRRRLWTFGASGACFAVAVLSKETMLLFAPALVYQVWQRSHRSTRAFCVTAAASVCALLVAMYPLLALLKGELVPGPGHVSLASAVAFQLGGRQGTGDPLDPSSQAHSLIAGWLHLDPWLLVGGRVLHPGRSRGAPVPARGAGAGDRAARRPPRRVPPGAIRHQPAALRCAARRCGGLHAAEPLGMARRPPATCRCDRRRHAGRGGCAPGLPRAVVGRRTATA